MQIPSVHISKLTFSDGTNFELSPQDTLLIVGPNNSGKSQALREIPAICSDVKGARPIVITNLELEKSGDENDLRDFLESNADIIGDKYNYKNWQLFHTDVSLWRDPYLRGRLTDGFIKTIGANERLSICEQQTHVARGQQKTKPQHVLYDDDALMHKVSGLFRKAFGKDLMFDFRAGTNIAIHVGQIPFNGRQVDRVGDPYINAVRQNPLLDEQGDGMKSYAGILFDAIVAPKHVTLIDEPEAFLHPPQMRKLGETLASEVSGQLLVATHSSDIMRGFIEATKGNLRILRIQRNGNVNPVAEASQSAIKELWEKPVLRYSNALEGIFHEQTIICEDDSDCRLINAVADHLSANSDAPFLDTAYVPAGGKHAIPKIAATLRQIGVPVKAVFDIDFLSERTLFKATVEAFGGSWSEFETHWSRLESAIINGVKRQSPQQIKDNIRTHLDNSDDDTVPMSQIRDELKQDKPWSVVKKFGKTAIPNGQAQDLYTELNEKLEQLGIYVIGVGEIENFCPRIGLHGPKFVTKVLSELELNDPQLAELRSFVTNVVAENPHLES